VFPQTFDIILTTFYPFNSLTPKHPGEPLVSLKMAATHVVIMVGRCRLTLSNPR
jgi:hypothetical protein